MPAPSLRALLASTPSVRPAALRHPLACVAPTFSLAKHRKTTVQKLGLAYERKVAEALGRELGGTVRGQWFCVAGKYCQTDVLIPKLRICVEVKLVDTPEARPQLERYLEILGSEWKGIVVVKNLTPESWGVAESWGQALAWTRNIPTFQWRARGKICT